MLAIKKKTTIYWYPFSNSLETLKFVFFTVLLSIIATKFSSSLQKKCNNKSR